MAKTGACRTGPSTGNHGPDHGAAEKWRIISVDVEPPLSPSRACANWGGYDHAAMPDRLEGASWASAAAATGGAFSSATARQVDMMTFLNQFRKSAGIRVTGDGIAFWRRDWACTPPCSKPTCTPVL